MMKNANLIEFTLGYQNADQKTGSDSIQLMLEATFFACAVIWNVEHRGQKSDSTGSNLQLAFW